MIHRIMENPRTISFRISSDKVEALDAIARAMRRDRSFLLNEAVEVWLSEQQRLVAMVEEGRRDLAEGRTFTHEEVERMVSEWEQAGR